MPIMDGITMSQEIYKIHKKQKILITSAYDDKQYLIKLIEMGVSGFLQKPLTSTQVKTLLFNITQEITKDKNLRKFVFLTQGYRWDKTTQELFNHTDTVKLSEAEKNLLSLLLKELGESFTPLEIFDAIYYNRPEKEFSLDTIKSLVKRLRKKLPKNTIHNTPYLGYTIHPTF